MTACDVSPELALVDPDLRRLAVARLPRLEPFDFLRLREPALAAPAGWRPPLLLAGAIYAVAALGRVLVMDLLAVLAIVLAIAGIQAFL
jgi:hypothetical protein